MSLKHLIAKHKLLELKLASLTLELQQITSEINNTSDGYLYLILVEGFLADPHMFFKNEYSANQSFENWLRDAPCAKYSNNPDFDGAYFPEIEQYRDYSYRIKLEWELKQRRAYMRPEDVIRVEEEIEKYAHIQEIRLPGDEPDETTQNHIDTPEENFPW